MTTAIKHAIDQAVAAHRDEAITLLQQLVRLPSVNHPPGGDELAVQQFYAGYLQKLGLDVAILELDDLPGFADHPGRRHDHNMRGRPNVVGMVKGAGGGRSLLLAAHADVEAPGDAGLWMDGDPFSGAVRDGKVFGRGAGDDKSGMAAAAIVARILTACGIRLHGDLLIASVPDEEQAGANGAVALACAGVRADACLYLDGVDQHIVLSGLGGGNVELDFYIPPPSTDERPLLAYFDRLHQQIAALRNERQREFERNLFYTKADVNDFNVKLASIRLCVDTNTQGSCTVWFYLLPGEEPDKFLARLQQAIDGIEGDGQCSMRCPGRFLLPAEVPRDHPFVQTVVAAYESAVGRPARLTGSYMSDMGMVNRYVVSPCILFGVSRWGTMGGAHEPDEYIEVERLMEYIHALVYTVMDWCGYSVDE